MKVLHNVTVRFDPLRPGLTVDDLRDHLATGQLEWQRKTAVRKLWHQRILLRIRAVVACTLAVEAYILSGPVNWILAAGWFAWAIYTVAQVRTARAELEALTAPTARLLR